MTKRILTTLALAAASAFALLVAAPAYACGPDCPQHEKLHAEGRDCDCPHHAEHHKADKKAGEKAVPPGKGDTKPAPAATPDKKAESAGAAGILLAADAPCKCEKGGKNCTCPKGKCKCANCHPEEKEKKKA